MICRVRIFFFVGTVCEREVVRQIKKYRGEVHCVNYSDEPLEAKIVSAEASTIFKSHLHCTISAFTSIFFKICRCNLWTQTWESQNFNIDC